MPSFEAGTVSVKFVECMASWEECIPIQGTDWIILLLLLLIPNIIFEHTLNFPILPNSEVTRKKKKTQRRKVSPAPPPFEKDSSFVKSKSILFCECQRFLPKVESIYW